MARRVYKPEQIAWLEGHLPHMTNAEAAAAFTEVFGLVATESQMHSFCSNHGIRKTPAARAKPFRRYTDEQMDWLRGFIPGHSEREIAEGFEARFGRRLTEGMVGNLKTKLGVRSGTHGGRFEPGNVPMTKGRPWSEWMPPESQERSRTTQFKAGHLPWNTRPLLDMREDKDGYLQIHVGLSRRAKPNDQWIGYGQFVWMQANGRDWPEGCICVFADHDNRNFDPDNIVPVPKDLYPMVQGAVKGQMEWNDRATLEVAITSARVTQARARLSKRKVDE